MNRFAGIAVAAVACFGCDDSAVRTERISHVAAVRSIEQLGELPASRSASDSYAPVSTIIEVIRAQQSLFDYGPNRYFGWGPQVMRYPGAVECTPTMCTFDLEEPHFWGPRTLAGSLVRSDDIETFQIVSLTTSGEYRTASTSRWELDGAVTVTPTRVDGIVRISGTTDHETGVTSIEYDEVSLDVDGCPIGGSIHAEITYTDTSSQPWSDAVQGTLEFGPGCDLP